MMEFRMNYEATCITGKFSARTTVLSTKTPWFSWVLPRRIVGNPHAGALVLDQIRSCCNIPLQFDKQDV